MNDQISIFEDPIEEKPSECCYQCTHFAELKEPRAYTNRDGDFGFFGVCLKSFCKNGSYAVYPVYIPEGKCKVFKKGKKQDRLTVEGAVKDFSKFLIDKVEGEGLYMDDIVDLCADYLLKVRRETTNEIQREK